MLNSRFPSFNRQAQFLWAISKYSSPLKISPRATTRFLLFSFFLFLFLIATFWLEAFKLPSFSIFQQLCKSPCEATNVWNSPFHRQVSARKPSFDGWSLNIYRRVFKHLYAARESYRLRLWFRSILAPKCSSYARGIIFPPRFFFERVLGCTFSLRIDVIKRITQLLLKIEQ